MLEIEYFTGGIAATNGYACKTEETSFLVDAPEGVADWLESTGFTPDALLLTHAHFDHVLDAAQVQERWSIPTYAFAQPTPELTLEAMLGSFGPMAIQPTPTSRRHATVSANAAASPRSRPRGAAPRPSTG